LNDDDEFAASALSVGISHRLHSRLIYPGRANHYPDARRDQTVFAMVI
jgi:hypothetical protein